MKLSSEECETRAMNPKTLDAAIQQIKMNGYVAFESVLSQDLVDELRAHYMELLNENMAKNAPNRGAKRWQMHLPFRAPFNHPDVISHPIVLSVIDQLLGENCICHYLGNNTPLPGSDYQPTHSDIHQLFPEIDAPSPVYCIVLDIPLVEFLKENGAMEIWPGGTHLMPSGIDVESLSKIMHSEQVLMPAGSLLIRDARMWHRGTPNVSDEPRPNIALMYARSWFKTMYPQIGIRQDIYDSLSDRAKQLFRHEEIDSGEDPRAKMATRWT